MLKCGYRLNLYKLLHHLHARPSLLQVTPSDYIITASVDGCLKFWKKQLVWCVGVYVCARLCVRAHVRVRVRK